jgi:hypothetical protein
MKERCRMSLSHGPSGSGKKASNNSHHDDLKNDDIKIEIDNDSWRNHLDDLSPVSPGVNAARTMAGIVGQL